MAVFVPEYWGCIPDPERVANLLMAAGVIALQPFVLAASVDSVFFVSDPGWWERRLSAWRESYLIEEEEVEIDEVPVRVYLVNRLWMIDVAACVVAGDCQADEPRCLQFAFVNGP